MMWKHWVIFALGLVVLLLPFLGFPPKIDAAFFFFCGGVIALLSFMNARALHTIDQTSVNREKLNKFGEEIHQPVVTRASHEEHLAE